MIALQYWPVLAFWLVIMIIVQLTGKHPGPRRISREGQAPETLPTAHFLKTCCNRISSLKLPSINPEAIQAAKSVGTALSFIATKHSASGDASLSSGVMVGG